MERKKHMQTKDVENLKVGDRVRHTDGTAGTITGRWASSLHLALPWSVAKFPASAHSSGLGWAGDLAAFGADFGKPRKHVFGELGHRASVNSSICVVINNIF